MEVDYEKISRISQYLFNQREHFYGLSGSAKRAGYFAMAERAEVVYHWYRDGYATFLKAVKTY